jgi:hypothetical protein
MAARMEAYPLDAPAGFAAGEARRRAAAREFPQYAPEIIAAERAWLRDCVNAAVAEASDVRDSKPGQATAGLLKCERGLGRLLQNTDLQKDLHEARGEAVVAHGKWVERYMRVLIKEGEYSAAGREGRRAANELRAEAQAMGVADKVEEGLLARRREAVQACMHAARAQQKALLAKNRVQAVAALGDGLARTLKEEAEAVDLAADLEKFCEQCRGGGLAQQADK